MAKSYGGLRPSVTVSPQEIQNFVDTTLSDGLKRGKSISIGELNQKLVKNLKQHKINVVNKEIRLTDDTVVKYIKHPKNEKGATLPFNRYRMLKNLVYNPEHIYLQQDTSVLVYTRKYNNDKIVKAVIHPNFKNKKSIFCKLKSIGVVNRSDMNNNKQYKKIK